MEIKNKEIFKYVEKQYNTQVSLLKNIDAKVANVLVVIGLLITATAYLSKIFYMAKGNPWSIVFLIPFGIGGYAVIKALFICFRLLCLTNYSVPSLEENVQTALTKLQELEGVDDNEIIRDFTQNYFTAFNSNQRIMNSRKTHYSSVLTYLKKGVMLLLVSFVGVFIVYCSTPSQDIKLKAKEDMGMAEDKNTQKSSSNTGNEGNEQKGEGKILSPQNKTEKPQTPKQPSAQGKPTIITAGEESPNVKIVEIKRDSKSLEKGKDKGK